MDPDPQCLEDIGSIRDALRQISQEAKVAVDLSDAKIEAANYRPAGRGRSRGGPG